MRGVKARKGGLCSAPPLTLCRAVAVPQPLLPYGGETKSWPRRNSGGRLPKVRHASFFRSGRPTTLLTPVPSTSTRHNLARDSLCPPALASRLSPLRGTLVQLEHHLGGDKSAANRSGARPGLALPVAACRRPLLSAAHCAALCAPSSVQMETHSLDLGPLSEEEQLEIAVALSTADQQATEDARLAARLQAEEAAAGAAAGFAADAAAGAPLGAPAAGASV